MKLDQETVVERFLGFDPATLYEAAGHRGMVDPAIRPAWAGARLCGVVATAECPPGDNLMLHQAVAAAAATPGVIIVATLGHYLLTGAWGEILTVAAQAAGVTGLAVDGAVRDIEAIATHEFPIFSRGLAIGSCTKERIGTLGAPIQFGGVLVRSGDIIVGDSDGLVIVDQDRADTIYEAAVRRRQKEAELMVELRRGKTTLELLGLPPLAANGGTDRGKSR
jgi:4-hydroxy-4-methyl-2-oxoglutarate aldolase